MRVAVMVGEALEEGVEVAERVDDAEPVPDCEGE